MGSNLRILVSYLTFDEILNLYTPILTRNKHNQGHSRPLFDFFCRFSQKIYKIDNEWYWTADLEFMVKQVYQVVPYHKWSYITYWEIKVYQVMCTQATFESIKEKYVTPT